MAGKEALAYCRSDKIIADAAYVMLTRDSQTRTGEFLYDEDVLREEGMTNFDQYLVSPGKQLILQQWQMAELAKGYRGASPSLPPLPLFPLSRFPLPSFPPSPLPLSPSCKNHNCKCSKMFY